MRTFILLSLIHYTSAAEAATVDTGVGECLLRTGRGMATPLTVNIVDGDKVPYSSRKPFPSLTQCYKFNTQACCVSGHDATIKGHYESLLSPTCIREYSQLEYYMCLGCNSDQPKYVDAKKNIHVCKAFADKLWTTNPRQYDSCGLNIGGALGFILPSHYYTNATHFLNALKPPYFEGYKVVVDADGVTENCLDSSAMNVMVSMVAIALTSFVTLLNM